MNNFGNNEWSLMKKMSKLRTCKLVKNKFGIEKYLELDEMNLRKPLTAFRISAHKLNIERGRYLNLKVEDRICNVCMVIEDEMHALCQCKKVFLITRTNVSNSF